MNDKSLPHPVDVAAFPNGEIGIVWSDGRESYYSSYDLRCGCACASCVDEMTGRKVLRDSQVPNDVRPTRISRVGNYAISIRWSDGHDTGIYTHERLRRTD